MLLLFLLAIGATVYAERSYVIVAPYIIRGHMDYAISVNILKATGNVTVTAAIEQFSDTLVQASAVFQPGFPGTITMKIPSSLSDRGHTLKVTGTGALSFKDLAALRRYTKEVSVFIQTDKAIYKPGDTVNFRILAAYADLTPYTGTMDVTVTDGASNKIKQWLKTKPQNGVITNELLLSTQPVFGEWTVSVQALESKGIKRFSVDEYVLPKYEVKLSLPSYVLKTESVIEFTVNAAYTYGKPVKGTLSVHVLVLDASAWRRQQNSSPAVTFEGQIDGFSKITVSLVQALSLSEASASNKILFISANVTESITNNTMNGNGTIKLVDENVVLSFLKSNPSTFQPGLQYTAYLKLSQPDGLPLDSTTDKVKFITTVTDSSNGQRQLSESLHSVPAQNGLVLLTVNMPSDAVRVRIEATFRGVSRQLNLGKSYSPSGSYLHLTGIQNEGIIIMQVSSTKAMGGLVYQVLSRGEVVETGTADTNGKFVHMFFLRSNSKMTPHVRFLAYYVTDDGEIVAGSISFDVEGIFTNKVSVSLNETEVEPTDKVKVTVQADPTSTAYLLAIDKSVLLLKSGNDITKREVVDEVKEFDITDTPTDVWPSDAFSWPYPIYYGGRDTKETFGKIDVAVLTDAVVSDYEKERIEEERRKHEEKRKKYDEEMSKMPSCWEEDGMSWCAGYPAYPLFPEYSDDSDVNPQPLPDNENTPLEEPDRVRFYFPESWLWEQLEVGSNGSVTTVTTAPDTITSWVVSAFAMNPVSGLGIATPTQLRVFQSFFVSLNLPYSMTRGEELAIQANIFNYLDESLMVKVTLKSSKEFLVIHLEDGVEGFQEEEDSVETIVVQKNSASSAFFPILPLDLGKIDIEVVAQTTRAADAVRRQLLVKAEGIAKEINIPVYIDANNDQGVFSKTVELTLPENVVEGSQLVRITAFGDILGPSISGLDKLIRMPVGCGEQTMLSLAPDVYIVDYLKATNQLTDAISIQALRYMDSGYQRELNYKHSDNSFSAFGDRDSSGSMWLTAYVARVFHQASPHIFIDTNIIMNAVNWIIRKQNADGSFPEPGRVIHKNMQSNSGSGKALTVFVLISLLENQDLFSASANFITAKSKALTYLEAEVLKSDDLYILAMAAYAFQLAGSPKTNDILEKLETKAVVEDDLKYWQTSGSGNSNRPNALNTEITSYVLLTYAARRDLASGFMTMKWIVQQRNSNGGFASTQDTVVALAALSEFARLTDNDVNLQVITELDAGDSCTFNIDNSNALVLQTRETKTVPAKVSITGRGKGIALVEIGVFFNVLADIEEVTFELEAKIISELLNEMEVQVCTRWLGAESASGMAVLEIGIISGFDVDHDSVTSLDILKRIDFETKDRTVVLYFDEIGKTQVCVNFKARRTFLVAKSQPAPVKIFDYYAPENHKTVFYKSDLLAGLGIFGVMGAGTG